MVPFNFAPYGWALCNGQILPISQNTALFSLLGTYYGGNGTSNFALPNLQGSAPMDQGNGAGLTPRTVGEMGGESAVTLLVQQLPQHAHVGASGAASNASAPGPSTIFGGGARGKQAAYAPAAGNSPVLMNPLAVSSTGSSQPHNNLPPYLTVNFVIALTGIYPTRS
jgi:microcystin-dependent protein